MSGCQAILNGDCVVVIYLHWRLSCIIVAVRPLSVLFWPLYCLSFDLRVLDAPLISPYSSCCYEGNPTTRKKSTEVTVNVVSSTSGH